MSTVTTTVHSNIKAKINHWNKCFQGDKHFMLDIETSGLDPKFDMITSVALVPFSGPELHDRHVTVAGPLMEFAIDNSKLVGPLFRIPQQPGMGGPNVEARIAYEEKLPNIYAHELLSTMREHIFQDKRPGNPLIWINIPHFDLGFIDSYSRDIHDETSDLVNYRSFVDLNTYIKTMGWDKNELYAKVDKTMGESKRHTALFDCMFQMECIQHMLVRRDDY